MVAFWMRLPRWQPGRYRGASIRTWLYRGVIGAAQDVLRECGNRRRGHAEREVNVGDPYNGETEFFDRRVSKGPTPAELAELKDEFQYVLALFPNQRLRNVVLWYAQGMLFREIGTRLKVSASRASQLYNEGLASVCSRLKVKPPYTSP
jgi:DNA-directed RNA polymerase specialized sigma24 family protein